MKLNKLFFVLISTGVTKIFILLFLKWFLSSTNMIVEEDIINKDGDLRDQFGLCFMQFRHTLTKRVCGFMIVLV